MKERRLCEIPFKKMCSPKKESDLGQINFLSVKVFLPQKLANMYS